MKRLIVGLTCVIALPLAAQQRPFGTLREQAALQQKWLDQRMTTVLPGLMRKHRVETWVIPMREYNEDPVFSSMECAKRSARSGHRVSSRPTISHWS